MSHGNCGFLSHGLWVCKVMHERHTPKKHRFTNRLFWFGLNLRRLDSLPQWHGLLSCENTAIIQYRDTDFFPATPSGTVPQRLFFYLEQQGVKIPDDSSVIVLGQLRTAGYLFNPIALYIVISAQNEPLCAIAEVTNTFYERKSFIIPRRTWETETRTAYFETSTPKLFYVSPFSDLKLDFRFSLALTPQTINLTVKSINAENNSQISTYLTGNFHSLTLPNLIKQLVRFPLLSQQVIVAIHWQAFCLWLKRIPYRRKEENPEWQIDLLQK